MGNRRLNLGIGFLVIILSFLNFIPIKSVKAENDNDLAIKEGDIHIWNVEIYNKSKYDLAGWPVALYYLGMKIEFDIEYIYKDMYYWNLEVGQKMYKTIREVKPIETLYSIPISGENYSIGNLFIRRDAEIFLSEWNVSAFPNYTVSGLEIKFYDSFTKIDETYVYQANGILSSRTYSYKGEIALKLAYVSGAISFGYFFVSFTVIAVSGLVFMTIKKLRGVREN